MRNKRFRLRSTNDNEQDRLRKEFEDVKTKIDKKQSINPEERDFFCTCLQLSLNPEDKHISEYEECKWNYGLHLFYVYRHDLYGTGHYINSKGPITDRQKINQEISHAEKIIKDWEQLVFSSNQASPRLLIEASKELKDQMDDLKRLPEFNEMGFFRQCNRYLNKRKKIILRNLALFVLIEEFLFQTSAEDLKLRFDGKDVFVTEFSLFHIGSRHYARESQEYDRNKTYHTEEVDFRGIHKFLRRVFNLVDGSNLLQNWSNNHDFIVFEWKNVNYDVYYGQNNVINAWDIKTFYPLTEEEFKWKYSQFQKVRLSERLAIYR